MTLLKNIQNYIASLDTKTFKRYTTSATLIIIAASGALIYYYYTSINDILNDYARLEKNRIKTQEILTRYAIVQKQQSEVETLLTQQNSFYLGQSFSTLMNSQNIPTTAYQQQQPVTESVSEDYNQIRLTSSISGIDMKQLVTLLNALEQEERVYIDNLDIMKDNKNKKLNVNLVIATLESKQSQTAGS